MAFISLATATQDQLKAHIATLDAAIAVFTANGNDYAVERMTGNRDRAAKFLTA